MQVRNVTVVHNGHAHMLSVIHPSTCRYVGWQSLANCLPKVCHDVWSLLRQRRAIMAEADADEVSLVDIIVFVCHANRYEHRAKKNHCQRRFSLCWMLFAIPCFRCSRHASQSMSSMYICQFVRTCDQYPHSYHRRRQATTGAIGECIQRVHGQR